MDTYADDLAELMETLDLRDAVLVGQSTGGGVWRSERRVSKSQPCITVSEPVPIATGFHTTPSRMRANSNVSFGF